MLPSEHPDSSRLITLFNSVFGASDKTELVGGAAEPYYLPGKPHRIYFRADYVRSALHEIAHWCVAGDRRRCLPDYGYWYSPDGRDVIQQHAFFTVEARPQAIERCFCQAIGVSFSPSVDNVDVDIEPQQLRHFEARLDDWYSRFQSTGLPSRAARFVSALRAMDQAAKVPVIAA